MRAGVMMSQVGLHSGQMPKTHEDGHRQQQGEHPGDAGRGLRGPPREDGHHGAGRED